MITWLIAAVDDQKDASRAYNAKFCVLFHMSVVIAREITSGSITLTCICLKENALQAQSSALTATMTFIIISLKKCKNKRQQWQRTWENCENLLLRSQFYCITPLLSLLFLDIAVPNCSGSNFQDFFLFRHAPHGLLG